MSPLAQYRALLAKVDAFFEGVQSRHPTEMQCRRGCHSCCLPGLTVGPLEAENIQAGLDAHPALAAQMHALETADPFQGTRCSFLRADGACGIYELRPVVCRSHGLALQFRGEDKAVYRDSCGLNFREGAIEALPEPDVMNLDTLNTLLATLTRLGQGEPDARIPLKSSSFYRGP